MVLIPLSSFLVGDIRGIGSPDELPKKIVTLTKSFLMSNVEVPKKWLEVSDTVPTASFNKGDNKPINYIPWLEVVKFCNRLSIAEGYDTCYTIIGSNVTYDFDANGYRLPTEAEWEYACRAGTNTDYYTGNMLGNGTTDEINLDKAGWYDLNIGIKGNPQKVVGQKQANAFGLYDMHGNVSEMCWDLYQANYYTNAENTNPTGPATGGNLRVCRGGCSNCTAIQCISSSRSYII